MSKSGLVRRGRECDSARRSEPDDHGVRLETDLLNQAGVLR
jgi:hypothetical protein